MFMLAVMIYGEAFTTDKAITFAFIWGALVVFTFDGITNNRKSKSLSPASEK